MTEKQREAFKRKLAKVQERYERACDRCWYAKTPDKISFWSSVVHDLGLQKRNLESLLAREAA